MEFTIEEVNLMCIFDMSGRDAIIQSLHNAIPDFDEPEMREIAETALAKLEAMTDAAFSRLVFTPEYDSEDDESEV